MLQDWVKPGWQRIEGPVECLQFRNEPGNNGDTVTLKFDDVPTRPQALDDWKQRWAKWAAAEKPAREALTLFERLYGLYGQIEREAEKVELYVGDGILEWPLTSGGIVHPILLQRLQLHFDPQVPEFTLVETQHPVDLYTALLRLIPDVDATVLRKCREEVQSGQFHPLDEQSTSGFLRRMIQAMHAQGKLVQIRDSTTAPTLRRDAVVFLQNRSLGFASAFEAIIEELRQGAEIPSSLMNVVGIDTANKSEEVEQHVKPHLHANEAAEILFSKPANPEQLQIAERLERAGSVLVQGPPGTGKTHTIANLIGHLLATNQTVLVTSHSTKALRVLREQIVETLRPLCVSVLESDSESQEQLKAAVESIVSRLSDSSPDRLAAEGETLHRQRVKLLAAMREIREKLTKAVADEYRDIVIGGVGLAPASASRSVAAGVGHHDWIPGPVESGSPLPLSEGELIELHGTNVHLTAAEESELDLLLPDLNKLPQPTDFERLAADVNKLREMNLVPMSDLWTEPAREVVVSCLKCGVKNRVRYVGSDVTLKCCKCKSVITIPAGHGLDRNQIAAAVKELKELKARCEKAVDAVSKAEAQRWRLATVTAGARGGSDVEVWQKLVEMIELTVQKAAAAQEPILQFAPEIDASSGLDEQLTLLREMDQHLASGGKVSGVAVLFRGNWKRLLSSIRTNGKPPSSSNEIKALIAVAELKKQRGELASRWMRQMVPLGGPEVASMGEKIEISCQQFSGWIQECLLWWNECWQQLQRDLASGGLQWQRLLAGVAARLDEFGDVLRVKDALVQHLPQAIDSQIRRFTSRWLNLRLQEIWDSLDKVGPPQSCATVVSKLRDAIHRVDPVAYRQAYQETARLIQLKATLVRRRELLRRLEASAPAWASAIRNRTSPHDGRQLPGEVNPAWLWRHYVQELDERSRVSLTELQQQLETTQQELHRITADLVDRKAWASQIKRIKLPQRQALLGWLQTIRKIGRGTGKRVPQFRAEARKLMEQSRTAVPVWIMPASRLVENFQPKAGLFDVVIIDEASQSSILELLAFYLGKRVVVVGDHEQVSPDAVGQNLDAVKHLIAAYLDGIPNSHLYDGQTSVYDLAMAAFGGNIILREHFRCVPEIIQFSNHLSYQGQIKPLRDSTGSQLRPHTIAHRVDGAATGRKQNENEAWEVATLLAAAIEQPEYAGRTFGVISLVGDEQAYLIDELLRSHLPPAVYESRRIMCGNSAQFQGDERDVMFLSVVDAPSGGPLALRTQPLFQKRFNVAASRGRDQMWVVHSLNHEIDLKPGDLRRRLIEYAMDPAAIMNQLTAAESKAESEFERLVIQRLISAGYRVTPQWRVGYYRIDIVVVGTAAKLAVECDGDRFHPIEKLHDDMVRQAILERLGWTFVRIRGSEFFRNPGGAMKAVLAAIIKLGIEPLGPSKDDAEIDTSNSDLLIERVRRRAHEIAKEWENARGLVELDDDADVTARSAT